MKNTEIIELIANSYGLTCSIERDRVEFGKIQYEIKCFNEKNELQSHVHGVDFKDAISELIQDLYSLEFSDGDFLSAKVKYIYGHLN